MHEVVVLPARFIRDTSGVFRGVVAMVVIVLAVVGWGGAGAKVNLEAPASVARTHAPCTGHIATKPRIYVVVGSTVRLEGGGYIGGCPLVTTTKAESVTMTVCLQRLKAAGFMNVVCTTRSRSWNRYTRFARSLLFSVYANCVSGKWRTDVRGGDGLAPTEWSSRVVRFRASDEYSCGEPGGA